VDRQAAPAESDITLRKFAAQYLLSTINSTLFAAEHYLIHFTSINLNKNTATTKKEAGPPS